MDIIEVKNLKITLGGKIIHHDVSFGVAKGECLGLIGASGAGKSVILRSFIGLERPERGEVRIHGADITNFSENELIPIRKQVAYVFQGGALFDSMSVFDNLAYPLREHTKFTFTEITDTIFETLDAFGLAGNEKLYPSQLSGGMQKRVGLARATMLKQRIVLYDEPTAGLDPYNTKKIQEMMLRLKSIGATSIFVTHDMPSAFAVCDRIALLVDGKIGAEGRVDELKKHVDGPLYDFINGEYH